jgi:hypothetical protein
MDQAEEFKQFLAFKAAMAAGGTPGSSGRGRGRGKREASSSPSPERVPSPKRAKPAVATPMNSHIKAYIERDKKFTITMTAGEANMTVPITKDDFTNTGALPVRIA